MKHLYLTTWLFALLSIFAIDTKAQCVIDSPVDMSDTGILYKFSDPICAILGQPYSENVNMAIRPRYVYNGTTVYACSLKIDSVSWRNTSNTYTTDFFYNSSQYGLGQYITLNTSDSITNICLNFEANITSNTFNFPLVYSTIKLGTDQTCVTTLATVPSTVLGAGADSTIDLHIFNEPYQCSQILEEYAIGNLVRMDSSTWMYDTVNCGKVYFYELLQNPATPMVLVDSIEISELSGFYWLPPSNGYFTAQYVPCDSIAEEMGFIPTYFPSTPFWNEADTLGLGLSHQNVFQLLTDSANFQGPGGLSGFIFEGKSNKAPGVPNVSVFLKSQTGQLLKSTKTDVDGKYEFLNIPYGTYQVRPEAPGVNVTPFTVTISANDTVDISGDFIYSGNEIVPFVEGNSAIKEFDAANIQVMPNPASQFVNIQFTSQKAQDVTIKIIDMNGKTVLQKNQPVEENKANISIDIQAIPAGIYTISTEGKIFRTHKKLLIIK